MKLTFKYPVYPTKTQETILLQWFDRLCELQNSARHDRIVALEVESRFVTLSNEARDTGLQEATQLLLFSTSPSL